VGNNVDIEFAIGEEGTYTVNMGENVTAFTGGTITFTEVDDLNVSLGTATMKNFGTPDNNSAEFDIPPTHSMTVGEKAYEDYMAQIEITGAGKRKTILMSVRIHKALGTTT